MSEDSVTVEEKSEEKLLEQKKEEFFKTLKIKYEWVVYIILAAIVFLTIKIRTLPMAINPSTGKPGLWDITTNNWTLGPDLDPFLFLRWAKDIIAHGSLMAIDKLRYVPIGFVTKDEVLLHPYLIAWFHKIAVLFGSKSVEYSAVVYPVVMFSLTIIFFFLFTRKLFQKTMGDLYASITALVASFFLSILPVILPRTIAGIPEKEASGFAFLFLAFYLFICAWQAKKVSYQLILSCLAGLATAGMALVWGGFIYIFLTLGIALMMIFFLGQIDRPRLYASVLWMLSSFVFMRLFSDRYSFGALLNSTTTLAPLIVIAIIAFHEVLQLPKIKEKTTKLFKNKIPDQIVTLIIVIVLGLLLVTALKGPSFITDKLSDIKKELITPIADRLGITVAENKQPFFSEWADSFGPTSIGSINTPPIFFWLFLIGSVYLYYTLISVFDKKERFTMTIGYVIFILAIIFSRYSSTSSLNGTDALSIGVYVLGILALVGTFGYYYYLHHKKGTTEKFRSIDFGIIMVFALFFFSIISARGAVRVIMLLAPPASILVGYLIVGSFKQAYVTKDKKSLMAWIILGIIIIASASSALAFYKESTNMARGYVPYAYTQQWQKAMAWVRLNTPETAVFGHWWDYGYWVQTMGERATVLDGGNAYAYWDYLMGRYGLTSPNETESLRFLYAHNTTHFLIDSSDIGKYSAFSTIGSDVNYDRASYIPTLLRDTKQSTETKNGTLYVYPGTIGLDDDIIYVNNDTTITLKANRDYILGITLVKDASGNLVSQPQMIVLYKNAQISLPIRYVYDTKIIDYGFGVESGIYLMPQITQTTIQKDGALLYLSKRVVNTQLARLYLFKEDDPYFKLVHSEDDLIVQAVKAQYPQITSDIVYYGEVRGPIRIWQINYPQSIIKEGAKQIYLQTSYPDRELAVPR